MVLLSRRGRVLMGGLARMSFSVPEPLVEGSVILRGLVRWGRDGDGRVGIVAARLECMSCKHVAESVYGKMCILG